jgi:tetratricopeptide (TPR) repeat protein
MKKRPSRTKFVATLLLSLGLLVSPYSADSRQTQKQLPPDVLKLLDQADRLEKQGQFKLAIPYFSKAIRLVPNFGYLYEKRGDAYNGNSDHQLALQDFDRALSLDDKLVEAYFGRAWAYDQLDKFASAVKDYEKYLTFDDGLQRDFAGNCLADNLGQMGQTDKAIKVLNKVIEHDPNNGQARRQRGAFLNSDQGNPKQAVVDFTVSMAGKGAKYRDMYALRATAYTRLKNYSKAIADYTTVLSLNTNDDTTFRARAAVYELMGDYKKAIQDYSAGIERNPDWAGPNYFSRARCYKKIGQNALAAKDLAECKRLNYDGK